MRRDIKPGRIGYCVFCGSNVHGNLVDRGHGATEYAGAPGVDESWENVCPIHGDELLKPVIGETLTGSPRGAAMHGAIRRPTLTEEQWRRIERRYANAAALSAGLFVLVLFLIFSGKPICP